MTQTTTTPTTLYFRGYDYWERPVFQAAESGRFYCDTEHLMNPKWTIKDLLEFYNTKHPELCDKCGDFESEPDGCAPISNYTVNPNTKL